MKILIGLVKFKCGKDLFILGSIDLVIEFENFLDFVKDIRCNIAKRLVQLQAHAFKDFLILNGNCGNR